jgi:hypothetical protein
MRVVVVLETLVALVGNAEESAKLETITLFPPERRQLVKPLTAWWWFWAVVGLGVALALDGTFMAVRPRPPPSGALFPENQGVGQ